MKYDNLKKVEEICQRIFHQASKKASNMRNLGTAKYVASKRGMEVSARDVENRQNSKYDALEGKLEISYSKE